MEDYKRKLALMLYHSTLWHSGHPWSTWHVHLKSLSSKLKTKIKQKLLGSRFRLLKSPTILCVPPLPIEGPHSSLNKSSETDFIGRYVGAHNMYELRWCIFGSLQGDACTCSCILVTLTYQVFRKWRIGPNFWEGNKTHSASLALYNVRSSVVSQPFQRCQVLVHKEIVSGEGIFLFWDVNKFK